MIDVSKCLEALRDYRRFGFGMIGGPDKKVAVKDVIEVIEGLEDQFREVAKMVPNIDDREAKHRNNPPKGSSNGRAKLSEADVLSARFERSRKNTSFQKLADKYGVSKKTIQNAIKGRTWKCVAYMPEPPKEELHE